jgi:hypothetical protein
LQAYSNKLKLFRNATDPIDHFQVASELMKSSPPFLVPAIVEALLSQEDFKSVTFVVPGEAEAFCIAAAKSLSIGRRTIAIFSDDSDLLVYHLSELCLIVPLRDVEIQEDSGPRSLSGSCFSPAKIAAQFASEHDTLLEAAFFIKLDHYRSVIDAFREAEKLRISKNEGLLKQLASFKQEYDVRNESHEWKAMQSNQSPYKSPCNGDARVSELIHQVSHNRYKPSAGSGLDVFLPFLLEDGSRRTAWDVSRDIRVAAYSSFLAFVDKRDECVRILEHTRSGSPSGIVATEILLYPRTDALKDIGEFHDKLQSRFKRCHKLTIYTLSSSSRVNTWHLVILQYLIDELSVAQKDLPSASDLLYILSEMTASPNAPNPATQSNKQREAYRTLWWKRFHLAAQHQAIYYSFRILQQLLKASLRLVANAKPATTTSPHLDLAGQSQRRAERLSSLLETLPSILGFSTSPIASSASKGMKPSKAEWERCLSELLSGFQGQQHDLQDQPDLVSRNVPRALNKAFEEEIKGSTPLVSAIGQGKQGSKRTNRRMSTNKTNKSAASKNPYDALSMEED